MKVLLTGANGFVGSHVLDLLRARDVPVAVLLRKTSNTRFIEGHLPHVDVHYGALTDPDGLRRAMAGATHVVHCAGKTKALRASEYYEANQRGTRNVVDAAGDDVQRIVYVSSLAAAHPATADTPAREDDPPAPVSDYGRSKLAGEVELRENCRRQFTILRPSAVYGPRDADFLKLFRAVRHHVMPLIGGGRQQLSLIYVEDLAEAVVHCLCAPGAAGRVYNVASPEVVTSGELLREVARQMGTWTVPLRLPTCMIWPAALAREALSHLTGKPDILSRQKYRELRAPGWVCDTTRLREEVGFTAPTALAAGIAAALGWYRQAGHI